ncbi:hypothetical protein GGTG_12258 [Gaeumannomyces tritici R3-111a-1]|uniref:Uncharacterized protein n=1 Tax=Gaeumannomyces tritici (strain R3-111a-1) TaxID=644352 RepID=J3PFI3_GAET3|nr:hypothetical protein GGTG_12258 [Gaeumannomyces tritici R3-111a-1]EJT70085.1 hypothetical protein GGTG_12258 [Gaeumannomyces tritici R3-111a-1]
MLPTSLYGTADARGHAVPSPAYDAWLSELPEPVSPGERFERELQSYPTGVMRGAKRKRGDFRTDATERQRSDFPTDAAEPDENRHENRPATSASFTFSRRLSSMFQPPHHQEPPAAAMDSRRWSLSFRPLSRASISAEPGCGGQQPPRAHSRLSGIFRPDPPLSLADAPPRVLALEDGTTGDYRLQVAFVGDATVGKTSLIRRFLYNHYVDREYNPTNKDLHVALMPSEAGVPCRVEMHDCGGGQEESEISHLTRCWWDAVVICFSVGDATTLSACLNRWVADARQNAEGVPIILAGLKSDRRTPTLQLSFLQENEVVSRQQAEQAARAIGADSYVECSARNNEKVTDLFRTIITTALPRVMENAKRAADRSHGKRRKPSVLYGTGRVLRGLLRSASHRRPSTASNATPPSSRGGRADDGAAMVHYDHINAHTAVNRTDTLNGSSTVNGYGAVNGGSTLNGSYEFFKAR